MREWPRKSMLVALLLIGFCDVSLGDEILRDPTRPYIASEYITAATPRFVVNAIIVSAERRIAIVNGRRVSVGGSVGGATVIVIEKDHLILEKDDERITAGLNSGVSRQ